MITFKQFILESKSAPLYHGTYIDNVDSILKRGFRPETLQIFYQAHNTASLGKRGVSFSRSLKSVIWYMENEIKTDHYAIFVIDQQKLNSKFKVRPIDYFGTQELIKGMDNRPANRRKEAEEFAIVNQKWDTKLGNYTGVIPVQGIVNKILYPVLSKPLDPLDTRYMDVIEKLKKNYSQFKWEALK